MAQTRAVEPALSAKERGSGENDTAEGVAGAAAMLRQDAEVFEVKPGSSRRVDDK